MEQMSAMIIFLGRCPGEVNIRRGRANVRDVVQRADGLAVRWEGRAGPCHRPGALAHAPWLSTDRYAADERYPRGRHGVRKWLRDGFLN